MPTAPEPRVRHLDTRHVGRRVVEYAAVPSTNDAAAGEPDGTVVVAGFQTAGRGQYGRVWDSRPGASVLLSVVLFPPANLQRPVVLTAWAAVAVADAVAEFAGSADIRVKWPNDVLVRGKKICGILTEQTSVGGELRTVVGIGLNLNQTAAEFAAAGLPTATSLADITGETFDPRTAADGLIRHLDAGYSRLLAGDFGPLETAWTDRVGLVGRAVSVELAGGSRVEGVLRGLTFDGLDLGGPERIRPEFVRHVHPL